MPLIYLQYFPPSNLDFEVDLLSSFRNGLSLASLYQDHIGTLQLS